MYVIIVDAANIKADSFSNISEISGIKLSLDSSGTIFVITKIKTIAVDTASQNSVVLYPLFIFYPTLFTINETIPPIIIEAMVAIK